MRIRRHLCLCALPSLLFLGQLAKAQGSSAVCFDPSPGAYNASAEKTINGFYTNRTYSFSTAVKELLDYDNNQSSIQQNYWMTANPVIDTSWQDLSFGGCLFILNQQATPSLQPNSALNNPEGATTCEQVLPSGCNDAWLRQLNNSVLQLPKSQLNDTESSCRSLNNTMPKECLDAFGNFSTTISAFGAPFPGLPVLGSNVQCSSEINIFNGSSTQNAFARDSSTSFAAVHHLNLSTTIGNNTVYDYFVKRTNAVFMAAWPRGSAAVSSFQPVVDSVCLSPEEHILSDSRDPVNAGVSVDRMSPGKAVVAAITTLIGLTVL